MKVESSLKEKIFFVIPAYNEGSMISNVITNLYDNGYKRLIVVDDGSSDNTVDVVKKTLDTKKSFLIVHHKNKGQGGALRTGINFALKQDDCKYIVTFDSDGQHRISDIPKFIAPLEAKKCDIAIGSRFLNQKSKKLVPVKKRILLFGGKIFTLLHARKWFTDTHNGYRVMNKKAASAIKIKMNGFEHASEILDQIAKKKIPYKEVPVFIDYTDYSKDKGQSVWNALRIAWKMMVR